LNKTDTQLNTVYRSATGQMPRQLANDYVSSKLDAA